MKRKTVIVSVLSLLIATVAYITNFGFLRAMLFVMMVPFAHMVVIVPLNVLAITFADKSSQIQKNNFYFCLTYVIANIFCSDVTETQTQVFFGLIHNDTLCEIGNIIAVVALALHIALLVNQIILANKVKAINDI